MKRFMWSFLALLIVACVGVYLAGGFECFAASPGTAGAAIPGDRTKAYITLGILIVAALLFVTEAPLPITAMLVPVGLSSTGVLTSKVAFSYFGDNTVVLFMAMFIIGESTFVTGFADRVGQMALKLSKGDMKKLLLFSMIAVGGLSTVLSNTGTTAVAVPMIMGMCASAKVAPSKILMPVAFASSLGGTVTLVGTPPNGIINSMLDQVGIPQFGFFEFGKFGLILFAVGMLYYWAFGYRLLPEVDLRGQIQDVFASFHWLERHAGTYGLDLDRICLTGDSAGGHLAGLAACIQLDSSLQELYGAVPLAHPFRALAIAHGVCDVYRFNFLKPHLDRAVTREYLRMLFGPAGPASPLWGRASFEDTAPGLPLPPILVIASEPDRYYRQSRRLIDWLDRSPLEHETLHWTRAQGERLTHVFEVSHWDWPESRETNDRTLDFFRRACSAPEQTAEE